MNDKMKRLERAINKNKNLSDKFKENFISLINLMVTNLPDYDYSYFEEVLSNIKLEDSDKISEYGEYDNDNNILKFNKNKILENRIDIEHLFLSKVLSICTHKEENRKLKKFFDGISNCMAQVIIGNEGWQ